MEGQQGFFRNGHYIKNKQLRTSLNLIDGVFLLKLWKTMLVCRVFLFLMLGQKLREDEFVVKVRVTKIGGCQHIFEDAANVMI